LFLAAVLSVVLCLGGCGTATEVEDGKTVFTFPTSFLVVRTLFCLVLGVPPLCGVIVPIVLVAGRLHSAVTPSARQQKAAERTKTGTKTDEDEIGWARLVLMLLMGPLIGSYFLFDLGGRIHSGFNDKVILSDSGFISDVWIGFKLHSQRYSFKDIRAIRTWQTHSSGKGAQMRRRATITLKSGQQEAIPVNDLLRGAWPEIARKAVVNGIHIEGDF
jgi:hypothetical protein